jgi:hypothetical protein
MSVLSAFAVASEGEIVNEIPGQPWMYGIGAFAILLLLLLIITRLNSNR